MCVWVGGCVCFQYLIQINTFKIFKIKIASTEFRPFLYALSAPKIRIVINSIAVLFSRLYSYIDMYYRSLALVSCAYRIVWFIDLIIFVVNEETI